MEFCRAPNKTQIACFFKSFKCREETCAVFPTISEHWSLLEVFRLASLRHHSKNERFMDGQINVIYLLLSSEFGVDPTKHFELLAYIVWISTLNIIILLQITQRHFALFTDDIFLRFSAG
jgi:hypothetical protein